MTFSGKMLVVIILQVTKNQGFTLSLEDKFYEKPQGLPAVLGLRSLKSACRLSLLCQRNL